MIKSQDQLAGIFIKTVFYRLYSYFLGKLGILDI